MTLLLFYIYRAHGSHASTDSGAWFWQLGGLFLFLAGAAIFHTIAWWRLHGTRVEGVVAGLRRRGRHIHSVYGYALADGVWRQATSVQGGSSLNGRETGRRVAIRVAPERPGEACEATPPGWWALASGLVLVGGWLTFDAVVEWRRHPIALTFLALVGLYQGRKVWRRVTSMLQTLQGQGELERWDSLPIESTESFAESPASTRVAVRGARRLRIGVIFCLAGLVSCAVAYIPAHRLLLLRNGSRTQGTVLWLRTKHASSGRYNLLPEVEFTSADGRVVRFLDYGANTSPFRAGDQVTVLYLPGEQGTAIIDHGLANWDLVAGLLLLGVVLIGVGVMSVRAPGIVGQLFALEKSL